MKYKIALAGNPNSGKTTLFNCLTGSNLYVGNWPGVTVEKKEGNLNETTTDFNGNAQLIVTNFNSKFELSHTGPHVIFKIPEKTDKIKK